MVVEWRETTHGDWKLVDKDRAYEHLIPPALAFVYVRRAAGGKHGGIIFRGTTLTGFRIRDIRFDTEYTLEEIKALIETTVLLLENSNGT